MLEIIDKTTLKCIEEYARLNLPLDSEALLLIEVDGIVPEVERDAEKIFNFCKEQGAFQLELARDMMQAEELKAARRSAFAALARAKPTTIMEDIAVPRKHLAEMIKFIHQLSQETNILIGTFGHAGDGNLHPTVLTDERNKEEMKIAWQVWEKIMRKAVELGGTITGEHGVGILKMKYLEKGIKQENVKLMYKLKKLLDPKNILNPGKLFDQELIKQLNQKV